MSSITVIERSFIAASPQAVWDFTQSELHRPLWTDYCAEPEIIHRETARLIRFRGCGNLSGCWEFQSQDGGTVWTQTNTLSLENPIHRLLGPYLKWKLKRATRRSMQRVQEMLSFSQNLSSSIHEDFF